MEVDAAAPGSIGRIIDPIARAIKDDRITGLARILAQLHGGGVLDAPGLFPAARADRYARQLLWKDHERGFVVVAMTWAAGQGVGLHDHGGLWGAEIVVAGTMHETQYRLTDRDARGRYRLLYESEHAIAAGSVGTLCPPREYHDFTNIGAGAARTLHVYGGELASLLSFTREEDAWWRAEQRTLSYD